MDIGTLLLFGMILAALPIIGFLVLVALAVLTYVVKNLYPLTRRVALWAAKISNFLPLLILDVVLIFLIIVVFMVAFRLPIIAEVLLILLGIILVLCLVLVALLLELAILVYLIRIVWWLYCRWAGLFEGVWLRIMRLRVKHDVGKDKDVKASFGELRAKLSREAEQARRKISKPGK
jgi:hypothetical protein